MYADDMKNTMMKDDMWTLECRDIPEKEQYCFPGAPCQKFWCEHVSTVVCAEGEFFDDWRQKCLALTCAAEPCHDADHTCVDTIASNNTYCGGRSVCPQYVCVKDHVDCDAGFEFDLRKERCVAVDCTADPCKDDETCIDNFDACFIPGGACRQFKCKKDRDEVADAADQIFANCTFNSAQTDKQACVERIKEEERDQVDNTVEDKIKIEEKYLDAALGSAIEAMRRCLGTETGSIETCVDGAKAAFKDSGADGEDWFAFKDMVFFESVPASDIERCIQHEINEFMNATEGAFLGEDVMDRITKSCDDSSKDAFTDAGGDAEDWLEEKQHKAADAAHDALEACLIGLEAADTDEEHKFMECDRDAQDAFALSGGKVDEWAREKEDKARDVALDALSSCLEFADQTECDQTVKDVFKDAGGDVENIEYALAQGARDAGYKAFIACYEENSGAASQCLNDAYGAYKNAGGNPAPATWLVELHLSATENAGDLIKRCVAAGSKNRKECAKKAEDLYIDVVGAGSNGEVDEVFAFDVVQEQAKANAIKDALGPCVAAAVASYAALRAGPASRERAAAAAPAPLAATSDLISLLRQKSEILDGKDEKESRVVAHRACQENAKENFVNAGGDIDEYARQEEYAAETAMADKLMDCIMHKESADADQCQKECIDDFTTVAGDDKQATIALDKAQGAVVTSTILECKASKEACNDKAKETLIAAGGDAETVDRKLQEGARDLTATKQEACVNRIVKNATKADKDSTIAECSGKAEEVFVAAGGDAVDFAVEQRRGAGGRSGDVLRQCLGATNSSAKECYLACEEKYAELLGEDKAHVAQFDVARELVGKAVTFLVDCTSKAGVATIAVDGSCWAETKLFFAEVLNGPLEDLKFTEVVKRFKLAGVPTVLVDVADGVDVKALLKDVTKTEVVAVIEDIVAAIKDALQGAVECDFDEEGVAEYTDGGIGLAFGCTGVDNKNDALDYIRGGLAETLNTVLASRRRRLRSLAEDDVVESTRGASAVNEQAADSSVPATAPVAAPSTDGGSPVSAPSAGGDVAPSAPPTGRPAAQPTFEWEKFCLENPESDECQDSDNADRRTIATVLLLPIAAVLTLK